MYGVSASYLQAIRGPHQAYGYVEAYYAGDKVTLQDGTTRLPLDADGQNQVTVDATTPGARRTLSLTLAPTVGLFDALAPIGTELRAYTVLRYPSGVEEVVPQGVFVIDVQTMGYASSGTISITAPDRWVLVQNAQFLTPRASVMGSSATAEIGRLVLQALPAGSTFVFGTTSSVAVPAQTWDTDRGKAVQDLATAASLDVYFDRNGVPTVRDAPVMNTGGGVWTVDASQTGVLVDANRQRDRQKTYNMVVVNGTRSDGTAPFGTQFVWDSDATSATYAGPDPINRPELAGPFGVRPMFYSSPLLNDQGQALNTGQTILNRVRGLNKQLTLTSISNPALDDGDTIQVVLPAERHDLSQPVELHLVDTLTIPLNPSKTAMTIGTRSTQAG